ncbi:Ada metal-binding domain-containing protein [Candidatus Symbiopectobacterium sp.]|uniref:Ada metal-binding domain-containing protein n=1 Tax=Candidatus Symbiopectobacterium sp. TaxID=2816440 RepID=UPI00345CF9B6
MSTNARAFPEEERALRENRWWDALCRRDKQADGRFVYGVKTTGIFCMPSCASRLPLRENVQFFVDAEAARQAGFLPCKRCLPGSSSREQRQGAAIEHACQLMAQSETSLTLAQVATAVGISPYHFHRLFKAQVGVTLKRYAAALRGQRVRALLSGEVPVTQATLAEVFHSSEQFYQESHQLLGMPPCSFKHKGQGMTIHFAIGTCSLVAVLVAESERGVCAVLLGDDATALINELHALFANATLVAGDAAFDQRMALVIRAIDSPGAPLTLPLDIRGTAFQLRVW